MITFDAWISMNQDYHFNKNCLKLTLFRDLNIRETLFTKNRTFSFKSLINLTDWSDYWIASKNCKKL